MFRNYLKISLRYLLRYKTYTAINVLGLAVGITCCVLIMLFVRSEFSYDRFHTKADRIYRVWQDEKFQGQEFKNHNYIHSHGTCHAKQFSRSRGHVPCFFFKYTHKGQ